MLDVRKAAILNAVVSEYIETAQPVGSGAVQNSPAIDVSSATIRSEMAALESDGYLFQPHTSAGRVPTEKGYRYFVDSVGDVTLGQMDSMQVAEFFRRARGQIETMMRDTASLLSGLTHYAAVVVDLSKDASPIRSVQLVDLNARTLLVVVVFANGQVAKHAVESGEDLRDDQIDALRNVVAECLVGNTVGALPPLGPIESSETTALANNILDAVGGPVESDRVYVDGASKMAGEFDAIESVGQVLTILEQQLLVVDLMSDVLDRGLKVAIGTETGVEPLEACSVVVSPYRIDGEPAGSIAVLGPTRMHYRQTMAAVAMVSRQLGHRLSEAQ